MDKTTKQTKKRHDKTRQFGTMSLTSILVYVYILLISLIFSMHIDL